MRRTLDEEVAQWGGRWFARRQPVCKIREVHGETPTAPEQAAWQWTKGVAIGCGRHGGERLLELTLEVQLGDKELSKADEHVLENLKARLLEDLASGVARAIGICRPADNQSEFVGPDIFRGRGGLVMTIALGEGAILAAVAIPASALVPLLLRAMPKVHDRACELQPISTALGSIPVNLEARLGCVELSVSELSRIASGDVLKLNRKLTEPAALVLTETDIPVTRGALSEAAGRFALMLKAHD